MKKLLLVMIALTLGAAQQAYSEERTVQDATATTRTNDGSDQTTADNRSTTMSDDSSRISKGGFYIEPMIFASQEDSTIKTSQLPFVNDDTSGTAKGFGVGLKFGGHVSEILLLGLDARYARMKMSDSSFYKDVNADVYNIAPMIGVQTPLWGVRLSAGYIVAGENNPEAGSNGLDLKFKEAQGWRLGAGVHVAAVGVNVEYQDLTYNQTEIQSFGSVAANNTTSVDADTRGYTVTLSFPVEL